ncbi:hypothetical protein CBR_g25797 [Chara braunii]|uniref:Uncharacterized protein n=1 Tax=Chara braunii TaxID=69332 RepID=A0A388L6C8_CHABU|nr:hypothetical protein CBR_g25797 [Chara braunii]|eukprot:GBG77865.1 hypothetical protein CBR_g25797 [Chara braunii]
MAGENVWKLAVDFFDKWETSRLLGHDGAKWIMRKKKVKNVKPGVAYVENDKTGMKEVVYNVPMDPPTKKGKKEKEEGDWFVQVPEPDAHCWKAMESLTDNEKCRVLKKVLACEVVWVQAGSAALAKLGKLSVQDMVHLVKCDRVLVRLWNYYQFKHEKRPDANWSQRCPFLKTRSAIFKQFESRGLDADLWDGSRKYVIDSSLFKDYPPYMGCDDDQSIEATKKLAGHKKLSIDWRNKVLSVLTGSRLKSCEIALAEGIAHIKWKDTGDVISIASFGNDPLEANIRCAEVKEAVVATKSHTFVLDLCEPVDLKLWKPQAFDTVDSQLQTWCPSHWTLVVFVPRQRNLSFLASMNHLSFVKMQEGKWVRKSVDLRANTPVVYEGKLPPAADAVVRLPQKVTQTDVSDIPFNPCDWSHVSPTRRGSLYGDMERNPTQFINLLESVTKKVEGVCFLEKPHARSVCELVKAGRHVIAMEGNSELLQFTIDLVKSEVNSGAHICGFMVINESHPRAWNIKTDMWFKLSARKRNKIYDFLFLQTQSKRDTDAEYVHRKDHMFTLLDNYHGVSRMNAKTFLKRLQSLYFVESEEELTTANEEGSDTESLDLQYDQHPGQHTTGSSFAGPSTSPTSLVSPMAKAAPGTTPMELLLPEPQSRSTEADLGHDMIWHPGVIQPAIQKGEWIVAVAVLDEGWVPLPRGSKSDFLDVARIAVLQKVRAENDSFAPEDMSVISTVGRLFAELQDKCWLELTEDYYDLDTSPSKGRVDLKIPPPNGTHVSTWSRGPDSGENEGDEAGGGKGVPPGSDSGSQGDTTTVEGSSWVAEKAFGRQQSTGPGPASSAQSERRAHFIRRLGDGVLGCSPCRLGRNVQVRRDPNFNACRADEEDARAELVGSGAGRAACGERDGHSSEFDTGSGQVAGLNSRDEGRVMDKEKEGEEGDKGEELEERGEEGEEEEDEGEEGEEGEETKLAGLLGGNDGEKGELDTGDDERTFGDDDDRSGESSDGFGQLYGEHQEEDNDEDDTALGMETQVVTSLSAERDDYEVEGMTSAIDLQQRFNDSSVAVSLNKPSVRIDIEEVIDDILGDHHMSAQPSSMPGVDDPLDVKPSGGFVVALSPTNSQMLPLTITSGGEGEIGGRQDVTSPKKTAVGTRALDVLALPVPTSPITERRDKPAGK